MIDEVVGSGSAKSAQSRCDSDHFIDHRSYFILPLRGDGGTGRRTALKMLGRKTWGFESPSPYPECDRL